ncbi:hypothetical protein WMY93_001728 [Mugilogobius chulae]|uniref:Uncharacterized protein n=1 Tax=Mugilogobius chulae TaxID=88201 RepID=A0AAW0PUY2_9GOBI
MFPGSDLGPKFFCVNSSSSCVAPASALTSSLTGSTAPAPTPRHPTALGQHGRRGRRRGTSALHEPGQRGPQSRRDGARPADRIRRLRSRVVGDGSSRRQKSGSKEDAQRLPESGLM